MTMVTDDDWRKSSFSGDSDCVEVALRRDVAGVQDTKHRGTALWWPRVAFGLFVQTVRVG